MPGSVGSRGSGRYRRVSRNSDVDETLFASNHEASASRLQAKRNGVSRSQLKQLKEQPKATVLTRSALEQIKSRSVIMTQAERDRIRNAKLSKENEKRAKAEARKEYMLKLEEEAKKRENVALTAEEKEDLVELNATLAKAADQVLEQNDLVKTMRRQMMYAQCAKIREKQIEEKCELSRQRKAFEERQDLQAEIHRLKGLQEAEEYRRRHTKQRMEDAAVIREQIEANAKLRILEEERLEQEKAQMNSMIAQQNLEAAEKQKQKQINGQRLLQEVLAANKEAMLQKERQRDRDREEDQAILDYQEAEAKRLAALEAEAAIEKKRKDDEFHKMARNLKKVQPVMDNRSEQDEMRAKRHRQEQERKERGKEREEKRGREAAIKDLMIARKNQADSKIEALKHLALQDRNEWQKINRESAELQAAQDAVTAKQAEANARHQRELRKQIIENEKQKAQLLEDKRKQGIELKRQNNAFLAKIRKKKPVQL